MFLEFGLDDLRTNDVSGHQPRSAGQDRFRAPADHAVESFRAGETIYKDGDTADFVYEVVFGVVRITTIACNGHRTVYAFHAAGDIFGIEKRSTRYSCAEAVSEARVLRCSDPRLEAMMISDPAVVRRLWAHVLENAERAEEMCLLRHAHAIHKFAYFLLEMSTPLTVGKAFKLPMSRFDIAAYLGVSSETVSRAFTLLRQRGLILTKGRFVTLISTVALREFVGDALRHRGLESDIRLR
ncbi:helix-turn-helix domain-containing protein [Methylobacterium pseudosasicola]|uniref:CRP/FNR family transcriptional regulator, nitrogen fixation regulation protein n=1 Tax=Methylobacterium pseudosasicola TaxID=582667 RepID=A0A1I4VHJ5_9HYPH|nr:helix-turn-helix domain-containing protein [Methylobacterium pseudosasicola]SFN00661.1 CRP/FNR family transcriptional regulator, nitrogen fixation regulation protein [Methylobacterium pseudosasicola]